MQKFPTGVLKEWFLARRRDLPWRREATPYRVWISEVMLQQTQVAVVIPYFERWMETFPTIESLASAPIESVLKCWEGLGYYSRARHLHRGARVIMEKYRGELPDQREALAAIPGIGPYTQGAILSFAFKQKAAAVDGNVLRVLSRFLAHEGEIDAVQTKKRLVTYAEELLPDKEPWLVSEGLIELGAMVCAKKAKCQECPLQKECLAYRHRLQDQLPKRRPRPPTTELLRQVAIVTHRGCYLVQKRESGKLMADLYEFPYLESGVQAEAPHQKFEALFGFPLRYIRALPVQNHTFTRYRAQLFPHLMEADQPTGEWVWKSIEELKGLPFSSGHKRILTHLVQHENPSY